MSHLLKAKRLGIVIPSFVLVLLLIGSPIESEDTNISTDH